MNVSGAFVLIACLIALASANSEQQEKLRGTVEQIKDEAKAPLLQNKIYIEKPIIQEVPSDANIDPSKVQVAIPIGSAAKKIESDIKPKVEQQEKSVEQETEKLSPIPMIFPSILSNLPGDLSSLFNPLLSGINPNLESTSNMLNEEQEPKHRSMSIFLFKSNKNTDQQQQDSFGNEEEMPPIRKNILIMKIMPKSLLDGDSSDPDNSGDLTAHKTVHLLGGPSDPDNSNYKSSSIVHRVHLFGGPSEYLRKHGGPFTGGEESRINSMMINDEPEKHHETFMEKIKHFFHSFGHDSNNKLEQHHHQLDQQVPQSMWRHHESYPLFYANEIHRQQAEQNNNKRRCKMFSFLRYNSHHYYRILTHLLFISGLILIGLIFSMFLMRAYRRRRSAYRYYTQHDMNISSIDAQGKLKKETTRPNNWYQSDNSIISEAQIAHPAPPPAYAEKLSSSSSTKQMPVSSTSIRSASSSGGSNSSLVNSLALAYKSRYQSVPRKSQDEDAKSIQSMPPAYSDDENNNNKK